MVSLAAKLLAHSMLHNRTAAAPLLLLLLLLCLWRHAAHATHLHGANMCHVC